MIGERIDFISAYCDRWCERCAFTDRCSLFAATAAIAMCGDFSEGIELAVGAPRSEDGDPEVDRGGWMESCADDDEVDSPAEAAALAEEERKEADVRGHPVLVLAHACALVAFRWLQDREASCAPGDDPALAEAIEVASHDAGLVPAKLYRALRGRSDDDDLMPGGRDSNGSAKVALISIERSALAWEVIAAATGQQAPAEMSGQLQALRSLVEAEFPDAWAFARPGFDDTP